MMIVHKMSKIPSAKREPWLAQCGGAVRCSRGFRLLVASLGGVSLTEEAVFFQYAIGRFAIEVIVNFIGSVDQLYRDPLRFTLIPPPPRPPQY